MQDVEIKVVCKANGEVIIDSHSYKGQCEQVAAQLRAALADRFHVDAVADHDHTFIKDEKVIAQVANQ